MLNRHFSVRSRLLASVMVGAFPAMAIAADTTVNSGQTVGQVQFSGSDQVNIAAGGTVSTTNQGGVVMTGDSTGVVINNAGLITVSGAFSGIAIPGGSPTRAGPITITNSGTINAPSAVGVFLSGATGPVTLSNSGTITGAANAIVTGSGNDTLNLSTGSIINGATQLGGGTDTINLAGTVATKTAQQTVTGFVYGGEALNVNSGYWTFDQAVQATSLNVAAGAALELDGTNGKDGYIDGLVGVPVVNGALVINGDAFPRPVDTFDGEAFTLAGSGTLEIKGGAQAHLAASATGLTTVSNGSLLITGASPGGVAVAAGSKLRIGANLGAPDVDGHRAVIAGGGTTGSVGGNIANSGSVIFDRSNAYTYAGIISGAGAVNKSGAGVLTLSGANTYTGATTVSGGTLAITGSLASSGISLAGSTNGVAFDSNANTQYAGVISGAGFFNKLGAGTLTLSGDSTYTGSSTLQAGAIKLMGASQSFFVVWQGNSLDIAATGSVAKGVYDRASAGGGVTITNAGLISAPIVGGDPTRATVQLNGAGALASTLTNSGTIQSLNGFAITMGAGNDTLNLATGSKIIGVTNLGGGTDTINLAGTIGTKTAQQTFGNIFGAEVVNVNSGFWFARDEVQADALNIAAGATLQVGDATVDDAFFTPLSGTFNALVNGKLIVYADGAQANGDAGAFRLSGTGAIDVTGAAATDVFTFGGENTFTGLTTVVNTTLLVTGSVAGNVAVNSGATLRVGANLGAPDSDNEQAILTGGGTTGSIGGNIANSGVVNFDRSNAATYAGVLSGAGTVTKTGAGVLTLSGANTYTGATTVSGGGLTVSAPFASSGVSVASGTNLTFTGPNALTYSGVVSGAGSLAKTGAGTLTLAGANTHSGGTNVAAGGLTLTGSVIGLTTLASGTTLNIASTGSARVISGDGVTVTNAGTIDTPLLTTGTTASINLGNAGNTLNNSGVIRSYNGNAVRFGSGADTLNLSTGSVITGSVFMGAGTDTVNLAGTSNTRTTSQTLGRIFEAESVRVNSGYWTLLGEVGTDALSVASGATFDIDDVTAVGGAFLSSSGPSLTIANSGAIILNTADPRLDIYADSLRLSGAGTLQLTGGGAIQYGANVTMTGATTITNGMVTVTGDNIASPFNVAAQGTLRIGAAFSAPDADGYVNIVAGGGTTGSVASNIANNGAVIFDRANASTYAGVMSGTGAVTKSGTGVLTLSGANTYTGATTVSGGGLVVSAPLSSSGVSLASGTGLTFTGANALTYAGVVSGAGGLTKTGAGVTTLSGANTYIGATAVSAGGLTVTGSIASQAVSVASGANFTFGSATNQTYAGVVSGAGSLGKSGAGTLTLTGANTISGGATVSAGTLVLGSTLGSNVTVASGATLQIGTGGTTGSLTGALAANGTVIFNRSDNYVYAGAFSGTGALIKRGAGLLTLDGLYTFSGTTTIEGGTIKISQLDAGGSLVVGSGSTVDLSGSNQTVGGLAGGTGSTVNIQNATLTINQAPSTTPTVFGGALTGSGALVVTGGGILDLAGTNTYTGPTTVSGGTLKVNGSIASPVTVNSGGSLGGSGTINGAVTIGSGGSISPGNSPGVQTIAGPLTLAAGSTMIVEVDPTATIKNDRINVTAGSATIANGAVLSVRPLGAIANYGRVNDYVILTASGGVNGTFGSNVSSTMALLTPSVSYTTNQVSLRLIRNDIRFASLATTSNQAAVATAAEGSGSSGAAFGALVGQDAAGAATGYDALSGELYGATASLLIEEGRHQRAGLIKQAGSRGTGGWARIDTGDATFDADSVSAEASNRSFGLAGGGQAEAGEWNLGFGLAYGQSDIDVAARVSASEVKTFRAGVYGGAQFGAWRVRVGADAAKHEVDATRTIVFPSISQAVTGAYDGSSRQLFGEVAYAMDLGGGSFEPFVELAGVWAKTDAFTEAGGNLGLAVAEQDRSLTFATVGARFTGAWDMGGGSVRPSLSLAWRRASGDIEGTSTAGFGTSSFTVLGAGVAKDTALVDAGVGFDLSETITGSVSYSGALSSDAKDNALRAGLFVRF